MDLREEEQALVALIRARNLAAEEKFFANFRLWIQQEIRRRHVAETNVEDVAQQVFEAAFHQLRLGRFQGHSSLKTWLDKIVRGKVADYWRGQPQGQLLSIATILEGENETLQGELVRNLVARNIDPVLVLTVREVLQRMPEQLRYILLLQRQEGYTIQEISRSLALTNGQVSRKLYKAEALFRRLLAETNDEHLLPQKQAELATSPLPAIKAILLRTGMSLVGEMIWRMPYSHPNKQAALLLNLASW